jgi:mono/diheme cytochrome c family protein
MKSPGKRQVFAGATTFIVVVLILAVSGFRPGRTGPVVSGPHPNQLIPPKNSMAERGQHLFLQNCAHCHGDDARGDEGPDLHGVTRSDEKIARIIKNGIKGEMPRFGAKFTETDVQSLVAYVRSLH